MRELAALHAHFSGLDPDGAPDWMTLSESVTTWLGPTTLGAQIAADRFADRLSARQVELLERLPDATARFFERPPRRLTLTHGDPKADNIMFTRDDGEVRALLIDWQTVGLRSPAFDFAYFLSGGQQELSAGAELFHRLAQATVTRAGA